MIESVASISVNSHSSTYFYIRLLVFILKKKIYIYIYSACYHYIPDILVLCVTVVYWAERFLIITSLNPCFNVWLLRALKSPFSLVCSSCGSPARYENGWRKQGKASIWLGVSTVVSTVGRAWVRVSVHGLNFHQHQRTEHWCFLISFPFWQGVARA